LMLQHGRFLTAQKWLSFSDFTGHFPKSSLSQKQFVWGNLTKKFALSREYQDNNILLSGSPKHDRFFNSTKNYSTNNILLATTGAMNISADTCTTNSQLKYDVFIKKIYDIIKKLPDKKLIIRPHPSPVLTSNVSNLIKHIDHKLPVMKNENLFDLIQKSELVITFNNSTICLDALSMKKPVISLQTDDWALDEDIVKMNGVLSIDNPSDCEIYIKKILFDVDFKNDLLTKSKLFLDQYLINQGNASKSVASELANMVNT
jgi:UDP-N-acetylglucosamine 2-epimerase